MLAKIYGKGRVYYPTLGHPKDNWDDPRLQEMYTEAIKWAMGLVNMGLVNADVTSRPLLSK
jgi:type 1 glutamine amidotransferase